MALIISPEALALLDAADATNVPIDDMALSDQLLASIRNKNELSVDEKRGALATSGAFHFQRRWIDEQGPWGIYWNPLSSWTGQDGTTTYQPDIANIDQEIVEYWMSRSSSAKHPSIRARFADLAWEIGRYLNRNAKGDRSASEQPLVLAVPIDLPRRAIDAYLDAITRELCEDEYQTWQFLDRAIGLATSINDLARIENGKSALFEYERKLRLTEKKFMWWRFDDLTWAYSKSLALTDIESREVVTTIEHALAKSSDIAKPEHFDPHDAMTAADRLSRRRALTKEPLEAKRALKVAAQAFEEAAKLANGLTAIAWLEDLIPRYRNAGMPEDAIRVEQTIRSRAAEAMGEMQQIEVPIKIDKEELDRWATQLIGSTFEEAAAKIGSACLIRASSTEKSLRSMNEGAPLSAMLGSSIMGSHGFTIANVGSIEDDLEGRAIQHAANLFSWYAPWLSYALTKAKEKYQLDVEMMLDFFRKSPFFSKDREPLLREGLLAWLAEDSVKAIHILIPQVECSLRDLLVALGGSAMIPEPNSGGFKVILFGQILNHQVLQAKLSEDIRFHLKSLYSDARGINLRNHVAHGLAHYELLNMGAANWVVHSLLLLGVLRLVPTKPEAK